MGDLASFFSNPRTIQAIGEIGVGIFSANQASKSRQRAEEFLGKLEEKQANRQQITNPYANIENPYKNLAVATQAAKMQAEEADIALANTLDTLRATGKGAGGATALAQAALKSKRQISANIEQQEVANEKLKAQGQLQVDVAKAKGEAFRMQMQESRDIEDIDRLQYSADLAAAQQQNQAANAVSGILGGVAGLGAVGMKSFMSDGSGRDQRQSNQQYKNFSKANKEYRANREEYDALNKKYDANAYLNKINENYEFDLMDEIDMESPELDMYRLLGQGNEEEAIRNEPQFRK
tara:strand:+ start:81 stop:962 length:882 start_codon:yes stop_codon:yes gene_type:complete